MLIDTLETLRRCDELAPELTPLNSTKTSIMWHRHHADDTEGPNTGNAAWRQLGEHGVEEIALMTRDLFDGRLARPVAHTADDPEKQEAGDGSSAGRHRLRRAKEYAILVIGLSLSIMLYVTGHGREA